jgi:hypothetical protein
MLEMKLSKPSRFENPAYPVVQIHYKLKVVHIKNEA